MAQHTVWWASAAKRAAMPAKKSVAAASSFRLADPAAISCRPPPSRPPLANRSSTGPMPKGRLGTDRMRVWTTASRSLATVSIAGEAGRGHCARMETLTHLFSLCSYRSADSSRRQFPAILHLVTCFVGSRQHLLSRIVPLACEEALQHRINDWQRFCRLE